MAATSTTSPKQTAPKRPTKQLAKPQLTEAAMAGMLREAIAQLKAAKASCNPAVLSADAQRRRDLANGVKGVVWRARLRASCSVAVLSADAQRRRNLANAWNEAMATEHAIDAACDSAFKTLAGAQRWAAAQDKSLRESAKPWLARAKAAAKAAAKKTARLAQREAADRKRFTEAAAKKTARLAQREAADRKRFTEAALRLRKTMAEAAAQRTM